MKFILLLSLTLVTVMAKEANDKDVEHWKNEADKNVNKDLDKWQSIVESGDHDQIHSQLENLQSQILSASNNMKLLVPVLGKMIDTMHYLGKDSGNFIKGMSLTGLVKMIHGKRDNKSYYLLDGAHQWIAERLNATKGKNDELAKELEELDTKVVTVQKQLDDNAATFVKDLGQTYDLISDTKGNAEQIKKVTQEMYDNYQSSEALMKSNQELIDQVNQLVKNNK